MTSSQTSSPYETGVSRSRIEQALIAAEKNLDHLEPTDLGMLEDFHTMGRIATGQLVDLVDIGPDTAVLDAGTGIGGTARYLAQRFGCKIAAVDLTEEYCAVAQWLNQLVGLDDLIAVRRADVTELPFADGAFQVAFSQHVQMNVADKVGLYREARRVLADGGQLAIWDIAAGVSGPPDYPLPWADLPEHSHLAAPDRLRAAIESAGFTIEHWNDRTEDAATTMKMVLSWPPDPLGLHAFVPRFAERAEHLTDALADGRLRAIQVVARATSA
ncbi:methyltransferase domain-containing protein [Nocardia nepalensis]|uniref:class I SAM-dependent methyltransferase n=1 Tax=Nocardia nepalensis TaxID=3375448 RepID=UPI003B67A449